MKRLVLRVADALLLGLLLSLAFTIPSIVAGCQGHHTGNVPDSLPAVGSGVEKTGAHVESAERMVTAAKPESNPIGKTLLNQASIEHAAALSALSDVRTDLKASNNQRATLVGENVELGRQLAKVTGGWGYRLQLTVQRVFWTIVAAIGLHYILGAAALFVPGAGGAALARIGVLLNPLAWFQSARDNYFFRRQQKQQTT